MLAEWYGHGPTSGFDWLADTIKAALLDGGYVIDRNGHAFFADVAAHEIAGGGYVAGGMALAGKTRTLDAPSETTTLGAADLAWIGVTFSARYVLIYKDTGNPATAPLLGVVDLGAVQAPAGTNFVVSWGATGILTAVAS